MPQHPMERRGRKRKRRSSEGGFILGMSVGVLIGLAVALAIAFYLNKTPIPFLTAKPTKADKDLAPGKPPAIAGMPQGSAPLPAAADKPKFYFYKIPPLPEDPPSATQFRQ